eukprot:Selendium_serpulae@DN6319_c0_g1_i2.p1
MNSLVTHISDPDLKQLLTGLCDECVKIGKELSRSIVASVGTKNSFGDNQLNADMAADTNLWTFSADSPLVRAAASEECPRLRDCGDTGKYILCWDPLDGSSIVDCNFAVGTIIGVWKSRTGTEGEPTLMNCTARADQVAAVLAVYGPRTTVLVGAEGKLGEVTAVDGDWQPSRSHEQCAIAAKGAKMFSPANLRVAQDLPAYKALVDFWMENRYTLRYTGGLVPDVYQMFVKNQGIFCNPISEKAPPKLRLLYECAPLALLLELAGGKASDGARPVLDIPVTSMDQRTALIAGTAEEVDRCLTSLKA